jgi:hypothetical protein
MLSAYMPLQTASCRITMVIAMAHAGGIQPCIP